VRRSLRGFTLLELLAAVIIIAIAAAGAGAAWSFSTRAAASRRAADMGGVIAVREMERLKATKYQSLSDTTSAALTYFDRYGQPQSSAATSGYTVKTTITAIINRDSTTNTEDLREIKVEVWNNALTTKYDSVQTLITFGGI
jgi:prepilin-type N-terminal cleavage/methylation domain-containing protein